MQQKQTGPSNQLWHAHAGKLKLRNIFILEFELLNSIIKWFRALEHAQSTFTCEILGNSDVK